jgi:D-alanine-D-alanine ligase
MGITASSKADNIDDLLLKLAEYKFDDIVVEEFIEGREFTALMFENIDDPNDPIVLEPIECVFSKGYTFKHFDLKWKDYNALRYEPVTDKKIFDDIVRVAKDTYLKLDLDGYIRYDIRMNKDGELFIVDVNPYCAIFYAKDNEGCADYILLKSKKMNNWASCCPQWGFLEYNIKCAIKRAENYK